MFHCAIGPPGHTANTFSQEWSPGTPWGGFDPSHHPPLLFWAPPGTTPTTLQRVVENTAFLSESGSWDNMVCLSTTTFPGSHFWLTKVSSAKTPPKTLPHVLTRASLIYSSTTVQYGEWGKTDGVLDFSTLKDPHAKVAPLRNEKGVSSQSFWYL